MASTPPIDPETVTPGDRGERKTTLEMDHDAAVEHVRDAFTDAGFGIATEFSAAEMLNEKIDAGRDPYTVIGACNPPVANEALDVSEKAIGGLFPCNVVVWEEEPGTQVVYHVSIMKIARLVGMAPDDDEWEAVVETSGEHVETAWNNLQASDTGSPRDGLQQG